MNANSPVRSFVRSSILPFALSLAAFLLYLRTLAPGLLDGDAGEFQMGAVLLGVVHATGYPLYLLLARCFTLLPLGDLAWRVNLVSAVSAAAAVGVAYLLFHRLARRAVPGVPAWIPHAAAALAAGALAVSGTFWSQAVIAEVYGLHALLTALTLYFIVRWADSRDRGLGTGDWALGLAQSPVGGLGAAPCGWALGFASLCFGLGLAHHRTTVLLAPALFAYVLMIDPGIVRYPRKWLFSLSLSLLPLLLYTYVPLRAPHTPYLRVELVPGEFVWLYQNDLPSFLALVTGSTFGGSLGLGPDLIDRLRQALDWLVAQFPDFGLLLGAWGAVWQMRRRRADLALLGLTFLTTFGFCLAYRIGDVYVLYIPAYLAFAGWLAIGIAWLFDLGVMRTPWRRRVWQGVVGFVAIVAVVLFPLVRSLTIVDRSGDTAARDTWEAILAQPLPSGAVLVTNDRNEAVPLLYLQHVEGRRPDLTILFPPMLPGPQWADVGGVTGQALVTGRPTYLIKPMPGLDVAYDLVPTGPLVRVAGPVRADLAHKLDLVVGESLHLTGWESTPGSPRPGQTVDVALTWQVQARQGQGAVPAPLGVTIRLAQAVTDGQVVAAWDGQPGGAFYPPSLWRAGQDLRVVGSLALPDDLPPGQYDLRAGFYTLPELDPLPTPAGDIPTLGTIEIVP